MPYVDDGSAWRDDRTREARILNDPYTVAAEKFVAVVEHFLYDESHPGYRNVDYLGWSISQFDATKRGSGNYADRVEWDPEDPAALTVPVSSQVTVGRRDDAEIHLPEDERIRREKDTPAKPKSTAKGKGDA